MSENFKVFIGLLFFLLLTVETAFAYIDPGTVGVIYQVGYLVFYGIVGLFLFFFRPIKNLYLKITGKTLEEKPSEDKEEALSLTDANKENSKDSSTEK